MAKKKDDFWKIAERVSLGVATGGLSEVARGGLSLARDFNRPPHGRLHPQRKHTRRKEAALHVPHPHALKGHKQGKGMERPDPKNPHKQGEGMARKVPPPPGRLYAQRRHESRVKSRLQRISRRAID